LSEGRLLKENCHRQEWLKKKGRPVKADVAMSGIDTEILMASYVENNTSQGKCWIFDFGSTIHDVLIRIF